MQTSSFVIAAPYSGSGKTTITIGILRALRNRGLSVQPFKCGPDYLDTFHHQIASSKYSYNLDLFMSSANHVKTIFADHSSNADVAIVEGAMGMFDGSVGSNGSAADVAKTLGIPVVLVIDARAMAYSAAPLLYGFKNFDKDVNVVGVIFNFVKSDSHYSFLKQAASDVGITSFGYLPPNSDIRIESRYLGLKIDDENCYEEIVEKAASHVSNNIDLDLLIDSTRTLLPTSVAKSEVSHNKYTIAVASDEAFNFMYRQNINKFEQLGEVVYFSPLYDTVLPEADFVYIAGGYPELYLDKLSSNASMLQSIKKYVEAGGKLLAECGGMMYLGNYITDKDGNRFKMAGVFDYSTSLQNAKLSLGYRSVNINGEIIKGHEFHYSQYSEIGNVQSIGQVSNASGNVVDTHLYKYNNAIASYIHLYWGETGLTIL